MRRHTALWPVLVLAVAGLIVAAVVAVVVFTPPPPTSLTVSCASEVGLMHGNLTKASSGQLILDIAGTTTASQADGTVSDLTLRVFAYLCCDSTAH